MESRILVSVLGAICLLAVQPDRIAVAQERALPNDNVGGVSELLLLADAQAIMDHVTSGASEFSIVNMWATWCAPCIEEFPYFVELSKQYSSNELRVVFVSVDFVDERASVEQFLENQRWSTTSFLKNQKDNSFVQAFGSQWTGAVPATFLFDKAGNAVWFAEGKTSLERLNLAVKRAMRR